VGGKVLANEIAIRPLELINGNLDNGIFQFYIAQDPEFLFEHTDEPVFYDSELDLYVWGITHYGTPGPSVPIPEFH
jgi:hypothetical protein ELI_2919